MSDIHAELCDDYRFALPALAIVPPQNHDTAPAVLDIESAQMAVDFSKLSVNGKRHAKAMIAGLLRLEAGAA